MVNEIWPLLRVLWLGVGAFKFHLEFDPDQDLTDFGYSRYPRGGRHRFWGRYDFEINDQGQWTADFDLGLQAEPDFDNNPTDFHFAWKHTDCWSRLTNNEQAVIMDN